MPILLPETLPENWRANLGLLLSVNDSHDYISAVAYLPLQAGWLTLARTTLRHFRTVHAALPSLWSMDAFDESPIWLEGVREDIFEAVNRSRWLFCAERPNGEEISVQHTALNVSDGGLFWATYVKHAPDRLTTEPIEWAHLLTLSTTETGASPRAVATAGESAVSPPKSDRARAPCVQEPATPLSAATDLFDNPTNRRSDFPSPTTS